MLEMFDGLMFAWIYLTGVVTLSLIFYFIYDRFEEKSWIQIIFGIAFLSYVAIGAVNNLFLFIIAGIILTYFICFPMRFLWMVILDAVQIKNSVEINADDEQFQLLDPEKHLTSLRNDIENCEREILKKQTMRSLAHLLVFIVFLVFASGIAALLMTAASNLHLILACILLFILCFQVQPRREGILVSFIMNYAFNTENIQSLEKEMYNSQSQYDAIEMGNTLELKKELMQRLRF